MALELPPSIRIKGGMVRSHVPGSGLYFDHEHLALVAAQVAGTAFVANHDRDITDRAATLCSSSAERFPVEFTTYDPEGKPKGKKVKKAMLLRYEAELTDDFPAYAELARGIIAIHKDGGVPNVRPRRQLGLLGGLQVPLEAVVHLALLWHIRPPEGRGARPSSEPFLRELLLS